MKRLSEPENILNYAAGACAVFLFLPGFMVIFGWHSGNLTVYGWGGYTRMALSTSLGFIIAGVGIFLLFLREAGRLKARGVFFICRSRLRRSNYLIKWMRYGTR